MLTEAKNEAGDHLKVNPAWNVQQSSG